MPAWIAQTLQAAGFDVVGVRDLDQDSLRRTFRDFIAKASAEGPDTVAFVYLSGYGLQLEGRNYSSQRMRNIARDANVSSEAFTRFGLHQAAGSARHQSEHRHS